MNPASRPIAVLILGIAALGTTALAQDRAAGAAGYPAKTIRIVSPFAAGGSTDTLARLIGPKLTESWGQSVVVDNRPGAGGTVAAELVSKAPPDGHTLLLTSVSAHAINPALRSKLPYHPINDFSPITQIASGNNLLVIHPSLPVKSVKELIGLARAQPGQLTFASGGVGTPAHLAGELFKSLANVKLVHVPYKGGGPAAIALMSGEASLSFASVISVLPQVKARRVRALAVTRASRSPALPDLPTVAEAGVPGFELNSWYGVVAPGGTPREIVAKLHGEIVRVINSRDVRERLENEGIEPAGTTPDDFAKYIQAEIRKWTQVVQRSGARAE
jgi:tripartite-type tricarboxylate transporter receptor subunit TctC